MNISEQIPPAWREALAPTLNLPQITKLENFLQQELQTETIFPAQANWFAALDGLSPERIKVVILGQDPYHGAGEAHGLAFSVPHGVKTPPSLRNIWQELASDLGVTPPGHGNLMGWAAQGVLLLNTSLTVRADCAGSHAKQGWDLISNAIIQHLATTQKGLVFLLWGSHAHKRAELIDATQHCVLKSAHPSPLSAYRGFFGCKHFSSANTYLIENQKTPIDWASA
ncbi:uracil-DNA glycosylase [Chitinibacter sp. SCUT-21]|uniref:uracil-DNA glycosylase n=1 Tax=Chitinibacter sp. SCUT-21 TaxID=2970891 RepID=UPI0035A63A6E